MANKFLLLGLISALYTVGCSVMHKFLFEISLHTDSFPPSEEGKDVKEFVRETYSWFATVHFMSVLWPVTLCIGMGMMVFSTVKGIFTSGQ